MAPCLPVPFLTCGGLGLAGQGGRRCSTGLSPACQPFASLWRIWLANLWPGAAKSGQRWQAPGPPALAPGPALETDRIDLTRDCDLLGMARDLSQVHRGREWGIEGLSVGGKSHLSVTKRSRRHGSKFNSPPSLLK